MAPGLDMAGQSSERGFVTTTDRIPLFYRLEGRAEGDGGAAVLVLHGYGEHSGRYAHVLAGLSVAGFDSLALDFRGHGQSGGRRGHVAQYDDYLDDLATGLMLLRERYPGARLMLLGHSQGGLISLLYLAERGADVVAAVVVSPLLALAHPAPAWKSAASWALSRFLPELTLSTGLNAYWLSRDPEVVRSYETDRLVHHVATVRWFTETQAAQKRLFQRAGEIRQPILLLQAGADRIVSAEATRRLFGQLAIVDKDLRVYDGHFHELLNEPDGADILGEVVTWLRQRAVA